MKEIKYDLFSEINVNIIVKLWLVCWYLEICIF